MVNKKTEGMSVERGDYKFNYKGKLVEIDSNTLITSLFHMTGAIQEINSELSRESNIKTTMQIKIKTFSGGSFDVHLALVWDIVKDLIPPTAFAISQVNINTIISTLIGIIKLKHFLKGKKPKEIGKSGNKITITDNEGNSITVDGRVYNFYNCNFTLNEAVNKNFETLREDPAVEGFELTDKKGKSLLHISKTEFNGLAQQNELLEEKIKILPPKKTTLHIFKIVFDENYKWQFFYEGNKISATIEDKGFMKRIDQGEKFSKGDSLICDLEIQQIFDSSINTYVNKYYRVLRVLEHKPRPEQGDLPLPHKEDK
jgi:hypothetical protein